MSVGHVRKDTGQGKRKDQKRARDIGVIFEPQGTPPIARRLPVQNPFTSELQCLPWCDGDLKPVYKVPVTVKGHMLSSESGIEQVLSTRE